MTEQNGLNIPDYSEFKKMSIFDKLKVTWRLITWRSKRSAESVAISDEKQIHFVDIGWHVAETAREGNRKQAQKDLEAE